jgi:hypothetical protein
MYLRGNTTSNRSRINFYQGSTAYWFAGINTNSNFSVTTDGGAGALGFGMFYNTRNFVIGSNTDAGYRLDVNGSVRTTGSISAASAVARGTYLNQTLVATANGDILVGLDIAPTFTNGAFTGLRNWALRLPNGSQIGCGFSPNYSFYLAQNETTINSHSGFVGVQVASFNVARFFASTGNLTLQQGGTFTEIPSARLAVNSTTQGVLIPRMTSTQRDAITSPAVGLQIFNTTTSCVEYFDTFWGWMPVNANSQWYASYGIDYFNDGINNDSLIGTFSSGTGSGANAGANVLSVGQGNRTFITGTTTTGIVGVYTGSFFTLGGGRIVNEYGLIPAQLSTPTERYYGQCGFFDQFGSPNQVDGVYFLYDEGGVTSGSTASPNWQCVTSSNSVRTFTSTSVAVSNSYTKLRIEINDAATQVLFYINGTLVATHTTNIPTGTARSANWGSIVQKQVGTTSLQTFVIDYYAYRQKFTTPR